MDNRFQTLDGWRGISILFVLAGHLLPIGPKSWQLNSSFAASGMAIFFILSGFLITTILIKDQNIPNFLTRRFLRIVPLAWLVLFVTLIAVKTNMVNVAPHFLFYANWPPFYFNDATAHFWSLCVEIQFYLLIAILVLVFKKKTFFMLPILGVIITIYRYMNSAEISIETYYRLDEILAGCTLAIIYNSKNNNLKHTLGGLNPFLIMPFLLFSAHPDGGFANYFRPYFAMLLVASTLFSSKTTWVKNWLDGKFLFYIASISYALYVFHSGLAHTWLGSGDTLTKYAKRPVLITITFALAHLSTFYYEKYWIELGKKLTKKPS